MVSEHQHIWHPVHAGVRQNDWEIVWVCTDTNCPGGQVKVTVTTPEDEVTDA